MTPTEKLEAIRLLIEKEVARLGSRIYLTPTEESVLNMIETGAFDVPPEPEGAPE